jgi:hypothetical protein
MRFRYVLLLTLVALVAIVIPVSSPETVRVTAAAMQAPSPTPLPMPTPTPLGLPPLSPPPPCEDCSSLFFQCMDDCAQGLANCNADYNSVKPLDGDPCMDGYNGCTDSCARAFNSCSLRASRCGAPGTAGGPLQTGYSASCLALYQGYRDQCQVEGSSGFAFQNCMDGSGDPSSDQPICCQQQYLADAQAHCYGCRRDPRNPDCVGSP